MNPQPSGATPTAPLTDADVAELDDLLQAFPEDVEPLDVATLDGFLAALLLVPEPPPSSEWLPFVFDAQGRAEKVPAEAAPMARALELIMRRHNELAAYLAAREAFEPVIFELEDDAGAPLTGKASIAALEPWAEGFMIALAAFPALMDRIQEDDASAAALTGILRHLPVDPDDDDPEGRAFARDRAEIEQSLPLADLDDAIELLVESVYTIADATRPRRPFAREAPKVGRNDPCPCGSGRKFKNCHGGGAH